MYDSVYSEGDTQEPNLFSKLAGGLVGIVIWALWLPFALVALPVQALATVLRALKGRLQYPVQEKWGELRFWSKLIVMDVVVFPIYQIFNRTIVMLIKSARAGFNNGFKKAFRNEGRSVFNGELASHNVIRNYDGHDDFFKSNSGIADTPINVLYQAWQHKTWNVVIKKDPGFEKVDRGKSMGAYSELISDEEPIENTPLQAGFLLVAVLLLATVAFALIFTGVFAPAALMPFLAAASYTVGGFEVGLALIGFAAVAVVGVGVSFGGDFVSKLSHHGSSGGSVYGKPLDYWDPNDVYDSDSDSFSYPSPRKSFGDGNSLRSWNFPTFDSQEDDVFFRDFRSRYGLLDKKDENTDPKMPSPL